MEPERGGGEIGTAAAINNHSTIPQCRDTAATVLLQEGAVQTDNFNGDVIDGPVPWLYAEDPGEAAAAIGAQAAKAFKVLQRLYGRLFVPENIPHSAAVDHIASPR